MNLKFFNASLLRKEVRDKKITMYANISQHGIMTISTPCFELLGRPNFVLIGYDENELVAQKTKSLYIIASKESESTYKIRTMANNNQGFIGCKKLLIQENILPEQGSKSVKYDCEKVVYNGQNYLKVILVKTP